MFQQCCYRVTLGKGPKFFQFFQNAKLMSHGYNLSIQMYLRKPFFPSDLENS